MVSFDMLPYIRSLVRCVIDSLMCIVQRQLMLCCCHICSCQKINTDCCIFRNTCLHYILSLLSLAPVLVHCGRHPAALFLHGHVCLDVRRGPSHLPHADRATQHQLRCHEVLLRHRLGRPCHYHRLVTDAHTDLCDVCQSHGEATISSHLCTLTYVHTHTHRRQ